MTQARSEPLAEGVVEIRRSCHDTFAYISNLENFPAWFPGVASVRALDATDHARVGKRYRETLRLPLGRTAAITIEVKEAQPGVRLVTEADGILSPRMSVHLAPVSETRTRVDWRMISRNGDWWFRWLAAPVLRAIMSRRARLGLLRLRSNLEREPAGGPVGPTTSVPGHSLPVSRAGSTLP